MDQASTGYVSRGQNAVLTSRGSRLDGRRHVHADALRGVGLGRPARLAVRHGGSAAGGAPVGTRRAGARRSRRPRRRGLALHLRPRRREPRRRRTSRSSCASRRRRRPRRPGPVDRALPRRRPAVHGPGRRSRSSPRTATRCRRTARRSSGRSSRRSWARRTRSRSSSARARPRRTRTRPSAARSARSRRASPTGGAASGDAWIYGLRENAQYRSNLALVHAPGAASGATVRPRRARGPGLRRRQRRAGRGAVHAHAAARRVLPVQPGPPRHRRARPARDHERLRARPADVGHGPLHRVRRRERRRAPRAAERRTAASSRRTRPRASSRSSSTCRGRRTFSSDLTLTNPTSSAGHGDAHVHGVAGLLGRSGAARGRSRSPRGSSSSSPNAIDYLRGLGLPIPATGNQGGTLLVSGAPALARTSNPNPDASVGGTFGLAYPAVGVGGAREGRGVGLRPEAGRGRAHEPRDRGRAGRKRGGRGIRRRRLRRGHRRGRRPSSRRPSRSPADSGRSSTRSSPRRASRAATRAIRPASGTSDFVAYGVVNDGPTAGSRTSDGSYVPMVVVN